MNDLLDNWIDYCSHPALFSWDDGKPPHNVQYSSNKKHMISNVALNETIVPNPYSEYQKADKISLRWCQDQNQMDINHPLLMKFENTLRFFMDKKLHRSDSNAAIHIDTVVVLWNRENEYSTDYRPGPCSIHLKNYREYWKNGKFVHRNWDNMLCKFGNNFYSFGPPEWIVSPNINTLQPNKAQFLEMQKLLNFPQNDITVFGNKFFHSITDEFRFHTIIKGI